MIRRTLIILGIVAASFAGAFLGMLLVDRGTGDGSGTMGVSDPGADSKGERERGGDSDGPPGGKQPVLPESSCPPDLANCVVASGRVIFVEAEDPDGDGDAHFITESEDGISAPGMTIFDVKTDLRPDPLPRVGDLVGGAGPVFRGSYGQKQIEVVEFHVAR